MRLPRHEEKFRSRRGSFNGTAVALRKSQRRNAGRRESSPCTPKKCANTSARPADAGDPPVLVAVKSGPDDGPYDEAELEDLKWRFWEAPVVQDGEVSTDVRLLRRTQQQRDIMYKTSPVLYQRLHSAFQSGNDEAALLLLRQYRTWLAHCNGHCHVSSEFATLVSGNGMVDPEEVVEVIDLTAEDESDDAIDIDNLFSTRDMVTARAIGSPKALEPKLNEFDLAVKLDVGLLHDGQDHKEDPEPLRNSAPSRGVTALPEPSDDDGFLCCPFNSPDVDQPPRTCNDGTSTWETSNNLVVDNYEGNSQHDAQCASSCQARGEHQLPGRCRGGNAHGQCTNFASKNAEGLCNQHFEMIQLQQMSGGEAAKRAGRADEEAGPFFIPSNVKQCQAKKNQTFSTMPLQEPSTLSWARLPRRLRVLLPDQRVTVSNSFCPSAISGPSENSIPNTAYRPFKRPKHLNDNDMSGLCSKPSNDENSMMTKGRHNACGRLYGCFGRCQCLNDKGWQCKNSAINEHGICEWHGRHGFTMRKRLILTIGENKSSQH